MKLGSDILKPRYAILLAFVVNIWTSSNMNWGGDNYRGIIASDACGYYAYLPAIFIYKDLQFSQFEKVEMSPQHYSVYMTQDYRNKTKEGTVDKYYVGCAVLWAPFFFVAHTLAEPLGYAKDGYTKPYHIAINSAALFYLTLGFWALSKLLSSLGFSAKSIFWSLLWTEFATHLFYYAVCICSFSHVYSFSVLCGFLLFTRKQILNPTLLNALLIGLMLGLAVIIRPVNLLVIAFIPFLCENFSGLKGIFLKTPFFHWFLALLSFVAILFIQLGIYKIQTGHFFVYSYGEEGFYFLHPELFNFLFSFRKGFFIYTPVFFLAMIWGGYILWKRDQFKFWTLLIPLFIVFYVFSSWYCWWYGYGFSQRPMVDFLFVFSILACLIMDANSNYLRPFFFLGLFFLLLNQFQIYQARYGLILPDHMTAEKYWDAFLNIQQLIEKTK